MVSSKIFALAATLASVVCAAPQCKPSPTVPTQGATSSLPSPPRSAVLKKILIGHGVQNYTCTNLQTAPSAVGALAVLYDVTKLYPGTPRTGLPRASFDALPTTTLWGKDVPLNMTVDGPDTYVPSGSPWLEPADLVLGDLPPIKFMGHHYFDGSGTPMFDLWPAGLKASVVRNDSVIAPTTADPGLLGTGAVAWLQLKDSAKGLSVGVDYVYRVITAGGNAKPCSVTGLGSTSIPYTTFYWFYKFY